VSSFFSAILLLEIATVLARIARPANCTEIYGNTSIAFSFEKVSDRFMEKQLDHMFEIAWNFLIIFITS
jgi:hypothetical protein